MERVVVGERATVFGPSSERDAVRRSVAPREAHVAFGPRHDHGLRDARFDAADRVLFRPKELAAPVEKPHERTRLTDGGLKKNRGTPRPRGDDLERERSERTHAEVRSNLFAIPSEYWIARGRGSASGFDAKIRRAERVGERGEFCRDQSRRRCGARRRDRGGPGLRLFSRAHCEHREYADERRGSRHARPHAFAVTRAGSRRKAAAAKIANAGVTTK